MHKRGFSERVREWPGDNVIHGLALKTKSSMNEIMSLVNQTFTVTVQADSDKTAQSVLLRRRISNVEILPNVSVKKMIMFFVKSRRDGPSSYYPMIWCGAILPLIHRHWYNKTRTRS